MRDYNAMIELIKQIALKQTAVRAVVMNGSRVLEPSKDRYQDYDIVYFVDDFDGFIGCGDWLDDFKDRLMMHTTDDMVFHPAHFRNAKMYQMLFKDENRIDLLVRPTDLFERHVHENRNYKVLLDKDGLSKDAPPSSVAHFSVGKPSESVFGSCVKEALWVMPYVAKGLCRDEKLYALEHLAHIRENLKALLRWRAGVEDGFDIILKKASDDLGLHIDSSLMDRYFQTYVEADKAQIWDALFIVLSMTEETARYVAKELDFPDNLEPVEALGDYLKSLRKEC